MRFNRQVLEKLTLDEGGVPGRVRTHSVLVGNVYRGAPAEDGQFLPWHRTDNQTNASHQPAPKEKP